MARRAYKRRSSRKSTRRSKRRRYARRYKKKSRTATGKLWKYVKKATKSEIKRCDILHPSNTTYSNSLPTGDYSQIVPRESKMLFQMIFVNNGRNTMSSFSLNYPWNYDGFWRFWFPYQLEFRIAKGAELYQRVGDRIFAKYINFKIHYYSKNSNDFPHHSSLYFVEVKRSVSGAYSPADVMRAIWDGICDFCRDSHQTEIYDTNLTAAQYSTYRALMAQSYLTKRKKYLKGIRVRKLHSTHVGLSQQIFPSYQDTGVAQFNILGTLSSSTYAGTLTASEDLGERLTLNPQPTTNSLLCAQPKTYHTFKNKLVTLNREWKYGVNNTESTVQSLEEYKYYLIALCSDYQLGSDSYDTRYYVSGELVFTDK